MQKVFIGRKPIMDKECRIFGYNFSFFSDKRMSIADVDYAKMFLLETDKTEGIQRLVGHGYAVFNVPRDVLLASDQIRFFPKSKLAIEVSETVVADMTVLRKLHDLKLAGVSLVLRDFSENPDAVRFINAVDYVKINLKRYTKEEVLRLVDIAHQHDVRVIAIDIDDEFIFNEYKDMGIDYFEGNFIVSPLLEANRKLDAAKQQLLSLLAKVNNPDTSFEELADLVKQNATLSHQLLVLVNQPQINLPSKVDSLQMALKYLGLVRIKLWITTLMMGSELDRPSELLTISLTRARFCELFAEKYGHVKEKESYFLVGLFSNLDAYFRMPMRDVVAQMPLSESLTEALVEQKGEMAITLKWINQFELGGPYNRSLKVPESSSVGDLNRLYLSAVGWAQEIRAKEQANSLADGVFAY